MKTLLFAALFSTLALASCNYEPSKEIFTDLKKPSGEGLSINLNDYPNKNIEVKTSISIYYTITNLSREVLGTQITIDGIPVFNTNSLSGSIWIQVGQLTSGVHVLRVEALLRSGTGSLADKFAGEAILLWTERNLYVDHNVPDDPSDPNAIHITAVDEVNNTIQVRWNKYSSFNFQQYRLRRTDYNELGQITGTWDFSPITDQNKLSLVDTTYLYGRSAYTITLTADEGKMYESPPFEINYVFDPAMSATVSLDGDVSVKWHSLSRFKYNFRNYTISFQRRTNSSIQYLDSFVKTDANDTTVSFQVPNFKLGQSVQIQLAYNGKVYWVYKNVETRISPGTFFPYIAQYANLHYDVTTQHFYANTFDYGFPRINKINQDGVRVDSASMYFQSWALGTDVPFAVGTAGQKSYKIDLVTMDAQLMPSVPTVDNVLNVSDNMRMFCARVDNQTTMVYDEGGQSLLAPTTLGGSYISADGNYTLLSSDIYKFNGTTFDLWATPRPGIGIWYGVRLGDPKLVLLTYFDRMDVYDLEAKSVVNSTSNFHTYCNFDPVSQKLGCNLDDLFVILNSDLTQYKSMIKDPNVRFFLLNETVLCSGSQIKLSDIP